MNNLEEHEDVETVSIPFNENNILFIDSNRNTN